MGSIQCAKFTSAKVFDGNLDDIKTEPIKYPKWTMPPKPDIWKEISTVELEDHGAYLSVPSKLDNDSDNVLTVICFSDTHTKHKSWKFSELPPADILLHAGDFTFSGNKSEVLEFEKWGRFISSLSMDGSKNAEIYKHYYSDDADEEEKEFKFDAVSDDERKYKHLICIAGNHELTFHVEWYNQKGSDARRYHKMVKPPPNAQEIRDIIAESKYWRYLEDTSVCLYGLNIYGSPWQPYFYNWAFQLPRGECLSEKWQKIPKDTDILVTHGPPFCHGDKVAADRVKQTGDGLEHTGDKMLMDRIKEVGTIKYHAFGHVHAGNGCTVQNGVQTTFINAASLNEAYHPTRKPIVFYIEKKSD